MNPDLIKDDSRREKFLLMLFPAALILAVYSVLFAVPMQQQKSESKQSSYVSGIRRFPWKTRISPAAISPSKENLSSE